MLHTRHNNDEEIWWKSRCAQSSLWYDNWTQLGALYYILPISDGLDNNLEEVNQITLNGRRIIDLLKELLNEEICHNVRKVLGNYKVLEERDFPWWMPNLKEKFTVNTTWEIMRNRKEPQEGILNIWEKGIPFKVSFLLWRVWLQRIPIGEVLVKNKITDSMIWEAGLHGPFVQLRQTIYKWWEGECVPKLRPLYKVVPAFIIWQLWKRRNVIRHGGKMSQHSMIMEVNRNLFLVAKYRCICPVVSSSKCNTDGSFKGDLNISTTTFYARDDKGDLVVAQAKRLDLCSTLEEEVQALKEGLLYCLNQNHIPLKTLW
ncbi:hypothetical protein RDI58_013439 [Solanum bulbocastanum]|uniref:Reverse transcriptase zinc-binding domain-containing protein n=1 Tax=Solanum bulbocastanum TaxID=147425 RepID=A0AAN8YE02_SOLBU